MMKIQYHATAADFLSHTERYLVRDEARYGLILGLAKGLVENPHKYGETDPWFYSVGTGTDINAVAMRTPPYNVLLAHFSGDIKTVAENLVTAVSEKSQVIPGVAGDRELADLFTERWCKAFGVSVKDEMAQRIYRLVRVNNVPLVKGRFRLATEEDTDLAREWTHAFRTDTIGERGEDLPGPDIKPRIAMGEIFFWEDGQPVSMAMKSRPTEKGMAVSYVYTPSELRGKGYATSCVAELSRHILQSGYEFCTLYADLANPTSNSVYMKIGFKEVCDSVKYAFSMPDELEAPV